MKDPFALLVREHEVLRRGLRAVREDDEPDVRSLARGFRRHLVREDRGLYRFAEDLFPEYEGTFAVLRADHTAIESRLAAAEAHPTRRTIASLQKLALRHLAQEERVLFPLLEARIVGDEARARLLQDLLAPVP